MRILRTQLRNYRIHRETEVAFHPDLTVIHGPNESGKSTLVEALHRALFLSHRVGGQVRDEMLRQPSPGHPEVEVEFLAEGKRWVLWKRFGGSSAGEATLKDPAGRVFSANEAEDRLARLVGTDPVSTGGGATKALQERWGHLWVWQGSAGENLLEAAAGPNAYEHGKLVARLQEVGEVSVQSALDQRVVSEVDRRWSSVFTNTGKIKANSPLDSARKARDGAKEERDQTVQRLEVREGAQRRYLEATRRVEDAEAELPQARITVGELEARLHRAREVRKELEQERAVLVHQRKELDGLENDVQALSHAQDSLERVAQEMGPGQEALRALKEHQEAELARRGQLRKAKGETDHAISELRRLVERASRRLRYCELTTRLRRLEASEAEVAELQGKLAESNERMDALAPVTEQALEELRQAEREMEVARTELRSLAARVRAVRVGRPVTVDGVDLAQGDIRQITDSARLTVGDEVELELVPGGGGSTQEVQARAKEAEARLTAGLEGLGVEDPGEASQVLAQRTAILQEQRELQRRLEMLAAPEAAAGSTSLERLKDELRGLEGESGGDEGAGAGLAAAEDPDATARLTREMEEQKVLLAEAEERASGLQRALDTLQRELDGRAKEIQAAEDGLRAQEAERTQAESRAKVILEKHGSVEALMATRDASQVGVEARTSALASREDELAGLEAGPGTGFEARPGAAGLEARLGDARARLAALERAREEARDECLLLEGELNAGAGTDLDGALEQQEAALESLEAEVARLEREAAMLQLLKNLLEEEQNRLATQFSTPLQRAMEAYLACLLPEGSAPTLQYDAARGFHTLRWRRGDGVAWDFDHLSGGAKEQLMAALRLSMAEVLAGVGEGVNVEPVGDGADGVGPDRPGLPVVFDDSFVNADPQRMEGINRMLQRAADRGLQVLVFTCDPAGVAALGEERMVALGGSAEGSVA